MIKAVIFDFFGVLCTRALGRFVDEYLSDDKTKLEEIRRLRLEADLGHITMDELIWRMSDLSGIPRADILHYLQKGSQLNQELLRYIRRSLKPSYKISILSNASSDYARQLMNKEDTELFEDIVLSYEQGMVKPDPKIYKLALSRLEIKPSQAVLIDDKPLLCRAAAQLGIHTVLYKDIKQMKADLEKLLAPVPNN